MLLDAMQHDKKTVGGQLRFVLPSRIGHVELIDDVPSDKARAAFDG
jgi:3-dehydroquinate synthase